MTEKRRVLYTDIETYSDEDIKKAGAFKYIDCPSFEILLLAYAWDDEPVRVLDLTDEDDLAELPDILAGLNDPDTIKVAHNSAFERNAYRRQFGQYQPAEEWVDTMILCAMNGLPMSLDAAGAALQLPEQKIKEGKALITYFCKPCKPTIANGGRTRNRPEHAPDKWARFKEYAGRDVEVMRTIYKRLNRYPVTDFERAVWVVDNLINERGVLIDRELAEAAVAVDEAFTAEHAEELRRLTGLDNPNSVAQLKEWLAAVGLDCDSLSKGAVADLKKQATDRTTKRVLELRQLLGKTSTTKYKAMLNVACADDRARGITQYYGAGRTGRWAGRLIQLQNLPQNHLDNIGTVRELVRQGDLETLDLCFDSVPDTLSQLIRTALVAKPGHTFLVADYSAIEARVIAYLAGEQWRMDVFAKGGDIYCSSASQMFKVPVVKHGVNGHLRQKGKIAELACIAEGQPVLTDAGPVPIERVTKNMKVWDGAEWVSHGGVIPKGVREVITYGGLEATEDHVVWAEVNGQAQQIHFGDAAARGARLIQTGAGRHPLRLGGDNQPREALEQQLEPLLCANQVQRLQLRTMTTAGQSEAREVERLPELLTEKGGAEVAGQKVHSCEAEVHQPEGQELQELRSEGHRVPLSECDSCVPLHDRDPRAALARSGARPYRRKRALRTGEPALGNTPGELHEPAQVSRKVRVYDIINAGPRHRFTVSDVLVHNCGYGGGIGALKAFGADKMGLTEEEMQDIVTNWRLASPTIPRFWRDAERAAKNALANPGRVFKIPCGVGYRRDADGLRCKLPSGRLLTYWGARLDNDGTICFMGQNQTTRKWEKTDTWGGKLVENIVQAYARDCLAAAILRLDAAGYNIVFHVHDEIIAEAPEGARWEDMAEIMGQPIDWAPGLLLKAEGYETKFYMKD